MADQAGYSVTRLMNMRGPGRGRGHLPASNKPHSNSSARSSFFQKGKRSSWEEGEERYSTQPDMQVNSSRSAGSLDPWALPQPKKESMETMSLCSLGVDSEGSRFPSIRDATVGVYTRVRPADLRTKRRRRKKHWDLRYTEEAEGELDEFSTSLKRTVLKAKEYVKEQELKGTAGTEKKDSFVSPIRRKDHIKLERLRSRTSFGSQRSNSVADQDPRRWSDQPDSSGAKHNKQKHSKNHKRAKQELWYEDLPDDLKSSEQKMSQLEITEADLERGQAILVKRHPWLFDSTEFSARFPSLKAKLAVDDVCTREMMQARSAMVELCRLQRAQKLVMGDIKPVSGGKDRKSKAAKQAVAGGHGRGAKASMANLRPEKMDRISRLGNSPFKLQQYAEMRKEFLLQCQAQENICMQAEEGLVRQTIRYEQADKRLEDYEVYHAYACRWGALSAPTFNRTRRPGQTYQKIVNRTATKILHWWFFWYPIRLQRKRRGAVAVQKLIRGALTRKKWQPVLRLRMKMGRRAYLKLGFGPWQRFWYITTRARLLLINHFKVVAKNCFIEWRDYLINIKKARLKAVKRFLADKQEQRQIRILRAWALFAERSIQVKRMFARAVKAPMLTEWIAFTKQSKLDKSRAKVALFLQCRYRGYKRRERFRALLGVIRACHSIYVIRKAKILKRKLFNTFLEEEITKYLRQRMDYQLIEAVNAETGRLNKLQEFYRSLEGAASPEIMAYLKSKEGKKEISEEQKKLQGEAKLKKVKLSRSAAKSKAKENVRQRRIQKVRVAARHNFWASPKEGTGRPPFYCIQRGCDQTFVAERHYLEHEAANHGDTAPCATLHALLLGGTGGADCLAGADLDPESACLVDQWVDRRYGLDVNLWLLQLWKKLQEWKTFETDSKEYLDIATEIMSFYFNEGCLRPVSSAIHIHIEAWAEDSRPHAQIFEGVEYASLSFLQRNILEEFMVSDLWRNYTQSKSIKLNRERKDVRGTVIKDFKERTREWASNYKVDVLEYQVRQKQIDKLSEQVLISTEASILEWLLSWGNSTTETAIDITDEIQNQVAEEMFLEAAEIAIKHEQARQKRLDEELAANIECRAEAFMWKFEKVLADWLISQEILHHIQLQNIGDDALEGILNKVSEELIIAAISHIIKQRKGKSLLGESDEKSQQNDTKHESPIKNMNDMPEKVPFMVQQENSDGKSGPSPKPIVKFKPITKSKRDLLETPFTKKQNRMEPNNAALKIQLMYRRRKARKVLKHKVIMTYVKKFDPNSRYYYYQNVKTGESTWTKPRIVRRLFPKF